METSRTLNELAQVVGGRVTRAPETLVSDVTHDSRQVGAGVLYVAVSGAVHDGHDFAYEAVAAGAAAICVERELDSDLPQLIVADTRRILGQLAAEVYGHPSRDIDVIGVTGTNGKTTVTHYIESILSKSGYNVGRIGTIGSSIMGRPVPSVRTTPEAPDFQRLLATMRSKGVSKVAVEVSSHALELGRVAGTRFAVASFTNLSQDHLDFHQTMEAYRRAKSRLFSDYEVGTAIFNIDDPVGASLSDSYGGPHLTVGEGGDFAAVGVTPAAQGSTFQLHAPGFNRALTVPVFGAFNVSNLLVAMASSFAAGAELEMIIDSLEDIDRVPGRFEIVSGAEAPLVIVDYAHTPAGILLAIETARQMTSGRVIAVIGAGGDRDRAKRHPMGVAASSADLVIVTSDNPRSEDPELIIDEVMAGVSGASVRQSDRKAAIENAIAAAEPGDLVLILGKGHEQGQERNGSIAPFDDRDIARNSLELLRKSANSGPDSGSMGQ